MVLPPPPLPQAAMAKPPIEMAARTVVALRADNLNIQCLPGRWISTQARGRTALGGKDRPFAGAKHYRGRNICVQRTNADSCNDRLVGCPAWRRRARWAFSVS